MERSADGHPARVPAGRRLHAARHAVSPERRCRSRARGRARGRVHRGRQARASRPDRRPEISSPSSRRLRERQRRREPGAERRRPDRGAAAGHAADQRRSSHRRRRVPRAVAARGERPAAAVRPQLGRHRTTGPAIRTSTSLAVTGPFKATRSRHTRRAARGSSCAVPARESEETACATQNHRDPGPPRLSPARRRGRRAAALAFYQAGRSEGTFDTGIQAAVQRILASPKFIFRAEAAPAERRAGYRAYRVSDFELASRLSFFLWSSIPDDELLKLAGEEQAATAGGPGAAGAAHAGRSPGRRAGRQLRGPVAAAAEPAEHPAGQRHLPGLRRQPPAGVPARDRAALRQRHPGGSQRRRPADRGLHLRQRAAGQALRHSERVRQSLPAGARHRGGQEGPARQGRGPDGHVARQPHVSGRARQVDPRQHPGHAPAPAAAARAGAGREVRDGAAAHDAASRWSSTAPTRCARAATS